MASRHSSWNNGVETDMTAYLIQRQQEKQLDIIACPKCDCNWMELVEVNQYSRIHSASIGQKPPVLQGPFFFFRCPKCGETYEPNITAGSPPRIQEIYNRFADHMGQPLQDEVKVKIEKL